jgi:hypothetical protein
MEYIHILLQGSIGRSLVGGSALQKLLASEQQNLPFVYLAGDKPSSEIEGIR